MSDAEASSLGSMSSLLKFAQTLPLDRGIYSNPATAAWKGLEKNVPCVGSVTAPLL